MKDKYFGAQTLTDEQLDGVVGGVAMSLDDGGICGWASTDTTMANTGSAPLSGGNTLVGSIASTPPSTTKL